MDSESTQRDLFTCDNKVYHPSGVISLVTPDGGAAIVELDHPSDSRKLVVIKSTTKGRLNLMNLKLFKIGTKVKFPKLEKGPDSFLALSVLPV